MATSGRKSIKIEAPVMLIEGTPVWMDKDWAVDFFDWLGKTKLKVSGMKHMQNKITWRPLFVRDCNQRKVKY